MRSGFMAPVAVAITAFVQDPVIGSNVATKAIVWFETAAGARMMGTPADWNAIPLVNKPCTANPKSPLTMLVP